MTDAKAIAYKTLHHRGAPVQTAKAILRIRNQFNSISGLDYEVLSSALRTLENAEKVNEKNRRIILEAKHTLFHGIQYPARLRARDEYAMRKVFQYRSDLQHKFIHAISSGNLNQIEKVYGEVTEKVCTLLLGKKRTHNLDINFFQDKLSKSKEDVTKAGYFRSPIMGGLIKGVKPKIAYNIHPEIIAEGYSIFYGWRALGLIVHELAHYEQYLRYNRHGLNIKDKFLGLFNDKASQNFIRFGRMNYVQPEEDAILYLLNPMERQARFREGLIQSSHLDKDRFNENIYFKEYIDKARKNKLT